MEKILNVENLKVNFNTYAGIVESVRGISFEVNKGETLAIVGESGSGKTVTAKSIMGLIEISNGYISDDSRIIYNNTNILDYTEIEWKNYRGNDCSIIFQDALTALNPTMTIGEQIKEAISNHITLSKKAVHQKAIRILERVGLPDPEKQMGRYTFELSGGQRQRAMIAMALSSEPKIIIADEPTTALDVTIQAQILELLESLQEEFNMTIILITHDLGIVSEIADRVIVMYAGLIMEIGSVYDIYLNQKHPYTWGLLKSVPSIENEEKDRLISIDGTPPDLINPPKACPFAERCKFSMEICLKYKPPMFEIGEGHSSACWLYHEESGMKDKSFEEILNEK